MCVSLPVPTGMDIHIAFSVGSPAWATYPECVCVWCVCVCVLYAHTTHTHTHTHTTLGSSVAPVCGTDSEARARPDPSPLSSRVCEVGSGRAMRAGKMCYLG